MFNELFRKEPHKPLDTLFEARVRALEAATAKLEVQVGALIALLTRKCPGQGQTLSDQGRDLERAIAPPSESKHSSNPRLARYFKR